MVAISFGKWSDEFLETLARNHDKSDKNSISQVSMQLKDCSGQTAWSSASDQ